LYRLFEEVAEKIDDPPLYMIIHGLIIFGGIVVALTFWI